MNNKAGEENTNKIVLVQYLEEAKTRFTKQLRGYFPRRLDKADKSVNEWLDQQYPSGAKCPKEQVVNKAHFKLGEMYYGWLRWRLVLLFPVLKPWGVIAAFVGGIAALGAFIIALAIYMEPRRTESGHPQNELYLQTWVFYDEVNDTVPIRKKYMDNVTRLLEEAFSKNPKSLHIFLIAHGDSVGDDIKNKEVTDFRVCHLDQIIEKIWASQSKERQEWYSKTKKFLWSFGKKMLIDESLNSKLGESKNRRVQIIVTTNKQLVEDEYLEFWGLRKAEPSYEMTDQCDNKVPPLSKKELDTIIQNLK